MYTLKEYMAVIDSIRSAYSDFNLTTDIIVGFPGETKEDFNDSHRVIKETGFSHVHTFKYSRRDGTRADRMDEQVPEKIKNERSEMIRSLSDENKRMYRSGLIGKTQHVLVEKVKGKIASGYGELYVPVQFPAGEAKNNQIREVLLTGIQNIDEPVLIGEPVVMP